MDENPIIDPTQARLNVTWKGENGDLNDTILFELSNDEVMRVAQEALRGGSIPGIAADVNATLQDFVVERFGPTADIPWARVMIRPKTPFGA